VGQPLAHAGAGELAISTAKLGVARLLAIVMMMLACPRAMAGECADPPAEYVAALEAGPSAEYFEYAVSCLGMSPVIGGRLWAGPSAASRFAEMRADTLRPRIARAVSRMLATSWADGQYRRTSLYMVAASRGIGTLDTVDVFTGLVAQGVPFESGTYESMAVLADCRAVAVLTARYRALRGGAPVGYPDENFDVLNSLYHIPCKEAVAAARSLLSGEHDPKMRDRLRKVVERP
jgi:hypothetical protein